MTAHHVFWHLTEATFGLVIVALISVIGGIVTRQNHRVEAKVSETLAKQDTGNDKGIGEVVHNIAQAQEILAAQLHTNTREILMVSAKADLAATQALTAAKKAVEVEQRVTEGHSRIEMKLDAHIAEASTMLSILEVEGDTT